MLVPRSPLAPPTPDSFPTQPPADKPYYLLFATFAFSLSSPRLNTMHLLEWLQDREDGKPGMSELWDSTECGTPDQQRGVVERGQRRRYRGGGRVLQSGDGVRTKELYKIGQGPA